VENDDAVVGGEPQIAFDARAHFQRSGERDQAVFREAGAIVKTPVSETGRSRV
jgi:hypothetical protein